MSPFVFPAAIAALIIGGVGIFVGDEITKPKPRVIVPVVVANPPSVPTPKSEPKIVHLKPAASPPVEKAYPRSRTWEELLEKNASSTSLGMNSSGPSGDLETMAGPSTFQLRKGKLYELYFSISQIGKSFILAGVPIKKIPYGVVGFSEGEMEGVTADQGDIVQAAARFVGYQVLNMDSRVGTTFSERYPIFKLVGLKNHTKDSFHSFESHADEEAKMAWEASPDRQQDLDQAEEDRKQRELAKKESERERIHAADIWRKMRQEDADRREKQIEEGRIAEEKSRREHEKLEKESSARSEREYAERAKKDDDEMAEYQRLDRIRTSQSDREISAREAANEAAIRRSGR